MLDHGEELNISTQSDYTLALEHYVGIQDNALKCVNAKIKDKEIKEVYLVLCYNSKILI